jgi:hypothetical protein
MESEVIIGILVRLLPSLAVVGLAFFAAADKKTRVRWGDLLYQVGSIRPDQREDPKIGSGVKWPFFIVALGLLLWPIQYYSHASKKIDTSNTDLKQQTTAPSDLKKNAASATPVGTPGPTPTPGPPVHGMDNTTTTPGGTAPAQGDLKPAPAPGSPSQGDLRPAPQGDLKPALPPA